MPPGLLTLKTIALTFLSSFALFILAAIVLDPAIPRADSVPVIVPSTFITAIVFFDLFFSLLS